MAESLQTNIMVPLKFIGGEHFMLDKDYGRVFLKEILECDSSDCREPLKINFSFSFFNEFILGDRLETEIFSNYTTDQFEKLFQDLGYFGCEDKIKKLRKIYKEVKIEKVQRRSEVRNYFREIFSDLKARERRHVLFSQWYLNPNLNTEFVEEVKLSPSLSVILAPLGDEYFDKHIDTYGEYWNFLCQNNTLTEDFFNKHFDKINWHTISLNTNLPESFFAKHIKKLTISFLASNSTISESFIRQREHIFKEKVLNHIYLNPNISEDYIRELSERKDWCDSNYEIIIRNNETVTEDFWKSVLPKIKNNEKLLLNLAKKDNISLEFIMSFENLINNKKDLWDIISSSKKFSPEFFNLHKDNFSFLELSNNDTLSDDFIFEHLDKFDINKISSNPALTEDLIEKIIKEKDVYFFDWFNLSSNSSLSENFFRKYKKFTNKDTVICNKFRAAKEMNFKKDELSKYL
jgi:hypothetical protein